MNKQNVYSCDFETTTDAEDCRVWAWIAIDIFNTENRIYGNCIDTFLDFCSTSDKTCYFHNLKFDGSFIIDYLLKSGFELNKDKKTLEPMQFNTLISDKGYFYTMCVKFYGTQNKFFRTDFIDSLKIIPSSVDRIAKDWKLPISKLEIDYKEKREVGHELTQQEKEYITNDALIVAIALKSIFDDGFTHITAASNAFNYYKKNVVGGEKKFRKLFPIPENDQYLRKSYRGGFTYVNPKFQNKIVGAGRVYDVNSLYPSVLHSPYYYPYGEPVYYESEYTQDDNYPLYVQRFYCTFKVKQDHLPMIQLKNTMGYIPTEYVTESLDDAVLLTLTKPDYELFFEQYDVYDYRAVDGYKYKASNALFDTYIDKFYKQKSEARKNGEPAKAALAKLMLNSFYGKFATNPNVCSRWPYLKDDQVYYYAGDPETREPIYIAVGTFCTSYARCVTIRAAQSCYDRFMYADTDSLHVLGDYDVPGLDVDPLRLGAFKHESTFVQAKYLRAKLYMEDIIQKDNTTLWDIKGAGMTDSVKKNVTLDTFNYGEKFEGKLAHKIVKGGTILKDTTFSIRK